jgi:hypothetical protein
MRSYEPTFTRIHRKLQACGFKYSNPLWVREATIGMIYQMCLTFKKLIEDPLIEDPSWRKPECIFASQEDASGLGMLSTPIEYCLMRVLSNNVVTLKVGDHIITLKWDELKYPSLMDPALVKKREHFGDGQGFKFRAEDKIKNGKGSTKKVAWTIAIRFLPAVLEKSNGKIFYLVSTMLQFGRSNPSSWAVDYREKLWNRLFDQILSCLPPVEEKQMPLPIPNIIAEPKIKIPEIIFDPRFKKIIQKHSTSYPKSLFPHLVGN